MPHAKIKWIIIGAPNSGKTSLFNKLTGSVGEVMNYPGSTASTHRSPLKKNFSSNVIVIDTPGIYGINGDSPEELEVRAMLDKYKNSPIIFVVDCRFIEHRIQLLSTLRSEGFKCVVYCTHVKDSSSNLYDLHVTHGISFIDSAQPLALKTLVYAIENIDLNTTTPSQMTAPQKQVSSAHDLDRLFLHPWFGFLFTLAAMIFIFSCVFYIAQPISDQIESLIDLFIRLLQKQSFSMQHPLLTSLISGGVLGLGALLVFAPQIFLLFAIILFIQESGYLARAAVILDPLLQKFGLHGKSFVSLLSGFSCAIPAILLSRTIESRKERLITILVVPFMMCSARVPMYAMCISFLLRSQSPWVAGLAFASCYFINIFLGVVAAGIINKLLPKDTTSYFMMELPPYKWPSICVIARSAANRVFVFFKSAGPIILGLSLIIWASTTFPNYTNTDHSDRLAHSYAAKAGQWIEPVFKPMGADWRVGTALLTSFAAREVFASSITLLLGKDITETTGTSTFESLWGTKKKDGSPLFSIASVVALLIFFMFALQCSSTTAVTAKETGSWKIALSQFVIMNGLAYTLAVITYQILSRI
ncbi:MAG: ferrous iron transporter B [Alphaproteobacteria bacterium]|nr:ferrous iron transporter B [Alphaproteobacteria bacterium]